MSIYLASSVPICNPDGLSVDILLFTLVKANLPYDYARMYPKVFFATNQKIHSKLVMKNALLLILLSKSSLYLYKFLSCLGLAKKSINVP